MNDEVYDKSYKVLVLQSNKPVFGNLRPEKESVLHKELTTEFRTQTK